MDDFILQQYRSFLRIRPGRQYEKWGSSDVKFGQKLLLGCQYGK